MKRFLLLCGALFLSVLCSALRFSVSTTVVDYADFGTLNVEGDLAVARRWTLIAGAKYNPYLFRSETPEPLSARQRLVSAGMRFWPWHVFPAGG